MRETIHPEISQSPEMKKLAWDMDGEEELEFQMGDMNGEAFKPVRKVIDEGKKAVKYWRKRLGFE